jgi:subtilisin family serine protease
LSGTSMSTPIVSGIIALALSTHGPSIASNIRERVIATSYRFETMSGKVYANGVINAYNLITGQASFNLIWEE